MPSTRSRRVQAAILLRLRRDLRRLDRLDRSGPGVRSEWQAARLDALRRHAMARSPWYRHHHRGLGDAPLAELPVLTKADVVDRFDELSTNARVRIADLRRVVDDGGDPPRGFRVGASSGSSGLPGLLPFDVAEWTALLVNAARARAVADPRSVGRTRGPVRTARIGSPSPWHLSRQLPATLEDPRKPALVLSAATSPESIASELAAWQPDVLAGYPSVVAALAAAQLDGAIRLAPHRVFTGGERLTAGARALIQRAWDVQPFDQYVTAELGFVAIECEAHDGLHVMDDHVLAEVVDADGSPVPPGEHGTRVLVTALASRTVPLIRYELGDAAAYASGACPCGRRTPRLESIASGARSLLMLPGADGRDVEVHPVLFTSVFDHAPVREWRVTVGRERVEVRVVGPSSGFDPAEHVETLRRALRRAGAGDQLAITVTNVDRLPRASTGKAALVEIAD